MYYNSDSIEDMIECLDKHKYDYTQYKHKNGYCSINSDILLNQLQLNKQELRAQVIDEFTKEIRDWQIDIQDNEYDADKFDFVFERIYEIAEQMKGEEYVKIE